MPPVFTGTLRSVYIVRRKSDQYHLACGHKPKFTNDSNPRVFTDRGGISRHFHSTHPKYENLSDYEVIQYDLVEKVIEPAENFA